MNVFDKLVELEDEARKSLDWNAETAAQFALAYATAAAVLGFPAGPQRGRPGGGRDRP